ncbi:MAG: hypothetical protein QXJ96_03715 [Candidatus Aenigmatarchaeota archaeon]
MKRVEIAMKIYEKIAFLLNLCLLVLIIVRFLNLWSIASSFLIIMIIVLLYKVDFDLKIETIEKKLVQLFKISEQLERIANRILDIREEIRIGLYRIEEDFNSKLEEREKIFIEKIKANEEKLDSNYRDIAKKIIDIENRMHDIKSSLASYVSYVEDLIKHEKKE